MLTGATSMGEEKFIGYFRLIEACGQPGCPICRCATNDSRSHLNALLYEQVSDPDTRRAIRASWGFCNWHTWMLLEVESSAFGAAIIYADVLGLALRRSEGLGRPAAYARSEGLCLPHLFLAAEQNAAAPQTHILVERTREKWAALGKELASFVSKHDYRNRDPYTVSESASHTRAYETLAGAKNLFGNDAHRRTSARPGPAPLSRPSTGAPTANAIGMPSHAVGESAP